MENNRKDRVWEEDITMRKLTVDDAALFNLKKIYFRQVEELCTPVLKDAGYSVGKIGFRNVNVLANCPFVRELLRRRRIVSVRVQNKPRRRRFFGRVCALFVEDLSSERFRRRIAGESRVC